MNEKDESRNLFFLCLLYTLYGTVLILVYDSDNSGKVAIASKRDAFF